VIFLHGFKVWSDKLDFALIDKMGTYMVSDKVGILVNELYLKIYIISESINFLLIQF